MTFKEFLEKYNIPHTIEIINKELETYTEEDGTEFAGEELAIVSDEDLFHLDEELKKYFPDYKYDYEQDMMPEILPQPKSSN